MPLTTLDAITLFVADPHASREFYERVFGARLLIEDENSAAFAFEGAVINLLARSAAPELVEPAPVAATGAGNTFVITLAVDDVDATCAELTANGVTLLNGPQDRPWGIRTASFQDPDGHIWEVATKIGG